MLIKTKKWDRGWRLGGRGAHSGGGSEAKGDEGRPLPGLDLATLLDASAYHTTRDAPERIRPGTLQVRGLLCRVIVGWCLGTLQPATRWLTLIAVRGAPHVAGHAAGAGFQVREEGWGRYHITHDAWPARRKVRIVSGVAK